MTNVFAAHISEDLRVQTNKEHLEQTAALAKQFGDCFGGGKNAALCGFMHDLGKYSEAFQKRIHKLSRQPVDHSTAGAVELANRFGSLGMLLAYCVAGHHTGLPDGGSGADAQNNNTSTLYGRLKNQPEPYGRFEEDKIALPQIQKPVFRNTGVPGFTVSFYIRMLYSCLVDADFLDTEAFMQCCKRTPVYDALELLAKKMDAKAEALQQTPREQELQKTAINQKRNEILTCCIDKAEGGRGLYTLTVPTGGGKTLSSLAFALRHARHHGMKRVIYVIPYNSIIEQNAAVFKEVLGEKNVLEHHCGIDYDDKDEDEMTTYQRLATENWDMPVVVSTMVQFFESLFSNKSSKCRKLHNVAGSVIVFDEAQLFPIPYLKPCVQAIAELVLNYQCTAVLCTATQPALARYFPQQLQTRELYEHAKEAFGVFKRTRLVFAGELDDEALAKRLRSHRQVLCIVVTRKQAQRVYALLEKEGTYHLSTFMCPEHRKKVLEEIRRKLDHGQVCRVVSTSLIEAGVDVDFPAVYRAEAGLDSLIQAAGRCNRNGKNPISPVYVFKPEARYRSSLPDMLKLPVSAMNAVIGRFDDPMSQEATEAYFTELYDVQGKGLDLHDIVRRFDDGIAQGLSFPFARIAAEFRLINESTRPIVIPWDGEACRLAQRLATGERSRGLLRSIQKYTVNVYSGNYDALRESKSIQPLDEELAVLADMKKYDEKTGLDASADAGQAVFV